MEQLKKLLNTEDSELAWMLRVSLYGLQKSLQEALETKSSDPGVDTCQEIIQELTNLLKSIPTSEKRLNVSSENIFESFINVPKNTLKLEKLRNSIVSDSNLIRYLGSFQLKSNTDEDLWSEIQQLLLRVPQAIANSWRKRAKNEANIVGACEDNQNTRKLPYYCDEIVYPSLSGTIYSQGLRLSKDTYLSPCLKEVAEKDLLFLAGVVSFYIEFIKIDTSLHHALQSVDRFRVCPLESEQEKIKYVNALVESFNRVQAAEKSLDPTTIIKSRIDLDEAIHSLVYDPPVERDTSWWGKLQREARQTLISKAYQYDNVQIRQLWGRYSDICSLSKHDLELDKGGIKGEVSACLRVYASINKTILPGRVLFRSLR